MSFLEGKANERKSWKSKVGRKIKRKLLRSLFLGVLIGNLRTTTKFTTTTSVDWEKTVTRTSVSGGKRKVKMPSVGRDLKQRRF